MIGQLAGREQHPTLYQGRPLDGAAPILHAACTRSSGDVRSSHCVKRCSMRSMVGDTAPISQRQAGRVSRAPALGAQDQATSNIRGCHSEPMRAVQAVDPSPGRRAGRTPRQVVLQSVARRDGAERMSLALTLLARASRTPLEGISSSRQEDQPA